MSDKKKEKKSSNTKSIKGTVIILLITGILAVSTGFLGGFLFWTLSDLPKIGVLEEYVPSESSIVYSSDGEVLAEFYVERRTFIPYYKIPEHVKRAFIAVEDARFYEHRGIDFIRIVGALIEDIKARAFVQGGSTITQQLAKMLFLKPERSISRKIKEAVLSLQIERRHTKEEILGLYLNQAYFGSRAYGIEAASQTHFGKSTENLTIPDAALLAALPKAPSKFSPFSNPRRALSRRNYVLRRMLENGFIDRDQYEVHKNDMLPTVVHRRKYKAPYFIESLQKILYEKYGEKLYTAGLRIHTELDYEMQKAAENAVKKGVEDFTKRKRENVQIALLAVELKTGNIKAMVGGTDFWETQFNRTTQAMRQPGSAFKPLIYTAALNQGFNAQDTITDAEVTYTGKDDTDLWTPQNYKKVYVGEVTLKKALSVSLNAATVCLAEIVGIENVIKMAQQIGIKSKLHPYLPSSLGASDMTLMELVYAYGTLAHGKRLEPVFYKRVAGRKGLTLEEPVYQRENVLDLVVVEQIRELLRAVVEEGTGRKAKSMDKIVYGKTGTTNDYTDAWFIGFDDKIAAGVWVGRDDHKPIGRRETGGRSALPIWIEFMKNI